MRYPLRWLMIGVIIAGPLGHVARVLGQTTAASTAVAVATADAAAPSTMWSLALPWWEFVLRGVIVYGFVLVLLRLTGKRQVGQLAPFDLVLLLVLSNAVQNSMNGGDNSVLGGMISAVTLVGLNYVMGWLTFKSKTLELLVEGRPVILVHNGHVDQRAMNRARMTVHELNAALRAGGCAGPHEAKIAVLENGGNITVLRLNIHDPEATPPTAAPPVTS
jgi:uncharacterized membrane protein YcaP (DUF421 family)